MAELRPLRDKLVVKPIDTEEVTKGGIIIPDMAKEKSSEGTIVSVGLGRITESGKRVPPEVKVGDRIVYGKYNGADVIVDGVEYVILHEKNVMAIIN